MPSRNILLWKKQYLFWISFAVVFGLLVFGSHAHYLNFDKFRDTGPLIACVGSVSVCFQSKDWKKDRGTGFSVLAARDYDETRARKWKRGEGEGKEGNLPFFPTPPRSFTRAIFRAVFDFRSSFFAPKPHGNPCYAGYSFNWSHLIVFCGDRNGS